MIFVMVILHGVTVEELVTRSYLGLLILLMQGIYQ